MPVTVEARKAEEGRRDGSMTANSSERHSAEIRERLKN